MGKYSTLPKHKVWAFMQTPYYWTSAIFPHIARKMNNVCILSRGQVTHDITAVHYAESTARECDMGWYRYTPYGECHSIECDMRWYRNILFISNLKTRAWQAFSVTTRQRPPLSQTVLISTELELISPVYITLLDSKQMKIESFITSFWLNWPIGLMNRAG